MTAPSRYTGRTVVVTGGTNGIGAATARLLRRHGAQVVILGRSATKAQQLVAESAALPMPGSLQALVSDFSSMGAVRMAVDDLAAITPSIDLLIHGVGVFLTRPETPWRASKRTSPSAICPATSSSRLPTSTASSAPRPAS